MAEDNSQYIIGNGMDAVSAMQNLYNAMLHQAGEEAKPVDTTEQPISPHDILQDLPNVYRRRVERVVKMINTQIEAHMDDLETRFWCEIHLHAVTNHERSIIEDACQQFVDAGWEVIALGYIPSSLPMNDALLFKFCLLGKLVNGDRPTEP